MPDDPEITPALSQAIASGSDLVGATTGAALGAFAGPVGAVAGGAAGVVVTRALVATGNAVAKRFAPDHRESMRLGAAWTVASNEISARLMAGEEPRTDELVLVDPRLGRSPAEEILEGVLRHAVDSYEEKKVPFLGHLFAQAAFDESYGADELHLLLNLFDDVTYRGLTIMAVVARRGYANDLLDSSMKRIASEQSVNVREQIVAELDALASSRLVGIRQDDGKVADLAGVYGGASFSTHDLELAGLTALGKRFAGGFQVERVPGEDQQDTLWQLAGSDVPLGS